MVSPILAKRSPIDELIDRNLEAYQLAGERNLYEWQRLFLDNARMLVGINTAAEHELGL